MKQVLIILFLFLPTSSQAREKFEVSEKLFVYLAHGMGINYICHKDIDEPFAYLWTNDKDEDPVPDIVMCINSTEFVREQDKEFTAEVDACMEGHGWVKAGAYFRP